MIKSIHVLGFQSLRNVSLSLGKLTVIVGPTDVGKSAVIRAVRALVENRRGTTFIHDDETSCQVSLETSARVITWHKPGTKTGQYYFGNSELQSVPADVALAALGIQKLEFSKRSVAVMINFQNQLDAPFLLSESDIVKSKLLGEITNASLILVAVNLIKRWSVANSQHQAMRLQDAERVRSALVKYQSLDSIRVGLCEVIELNIALNKHQARLQDWQRLEEQLRNSVLNLTRMNTVHSKVQATMIQIRQSYFGQMQIHIDSDNLLKFTDRLQQIEEQITIAKQLYQQIQIIDENLPDVTRVEQLMDQLTVLVGYSDAAYSSSATTRMLEGELDNLARSLQLADEDFETMKIELRVCPLCEAPLIEQVSGQLEHDHVY